MRLTTLLFFLSAILIRITFIIVLIMGGLYLIGALAPFVLHAWGLPYDTLWDFIYDWSF